MAGIVIKEEDVVELYAVQGEIESKLKAASNLNDSDEIIKIINMISDRVTFAKQLVEKMINGNKIGNSLTF